MRDLPYTRVAFLSEACVLAAGHGFNPALYVARPGTGEWYVLCWPAVAGQLWVKYRSTVLCLSSCACGWRAAWLCRTFFTNVDKLEKAAESKTGRSNFSNGESFLAPHTNDALSCLRVQAGSRVRVPHLRVVAVTFSVCVVCVSPSMSRMLTSPRHVCGQDEARHQ